MKTLTVFIVAALLTPARLWAQAPVADHNRPLYCVSDYRPSGKVRSKLPTEYPCSTLTYLTEEKRDRNGACIFFKGNWQRGVYAYNRTNDRYHFKPEIACNLGIIAMNSEDALGQKLSPSTYTDYYIKRNGYVTREANGRFVSTMTAQQIETLEGLTDSRIRPVFCNTGTSDGSGACSPRPNDLGYCALRNVSNGKFKGVWWVRYTSANQGSFEVCSRGARAENLSTASTKNNQTYYSATVERLMPLAFFDDEVMDQITRAPRLNQSVSACFTDRAGGLARHPCHGYVGQTSLAEPEDIDPGRCYIFKRGTEWAMFFGTSSGDLVRCSRIEKLTMEVFQADDT